MSEQRDYGKICQFNKTCPVYQGNLVIEEISNTLIKNVFCNRGFKGWKNCERYKLAEEGGEIPENATPYNSHVEVLS
ncbi:MAG TPA: hypothetical protein VFC65_09665 [Prolixibacteraceae bacterium]|nr:hypothetical protein [Prolixibacteraceae bacterium]